MSAERVAAPRLADDPLAIASRAAQQNYLRLLSAPLGEPVSLHVIPDGTRPGSAVAGVQ